MKTGLYDKHGAEICEGDLVKHPDSAEVYEVCRYKYADDKYAEHWNPFRLYSDPTEEYEIVGKVDKSNNTTFGA